jgi:ADP-heptose:LPS heptosyltransferase
VIIISLAMAKMWRRLGWSASLERTIEGAMTSRPFPILFITGARVSEAILFSGLVKRLLDEAPNARFTIVTGASAAPLFADAPGIDEIVTVEADATSTAWFSLWTKTIERRWGLVADLRGAGLGRWLRRRKRATLGKRSADRDLHPVAAMARTLGLDDDPPPPFLFTNVETEEAAERRAAGGGPILAVSPGASWIGKAWPAERFAQLAAHLLAPDGPLPGGRLMIVGGPEAREAGRAVKLAAPRGRILSEPGQLDLLETYALLRRARLFIGNEGGALHLAAAAGVPTLGLFGPSDERISGPWGPQARSIRGPRTYQELLRIDPSLNHEICHMLDLSTAKVVAAAQTLLSETEPADA